MLQPVDIDFGGIVYTDGQRADSGMDHLDVFHTADCAQRTVDHPCLGIRMEQILRGPGL